jgi:hypothetical protein
MKWFNRLAAQKPLLAFFIKCTVLFYLLFMSIALAALHIVIAAEIHPFFYINF